MDANKALETIKWTISKKGSAKDIEAYNTLVKYVRAQDHAATLHNVAFAKLFLVVFMHYARSGKYPANAILDKIEQALGTPLRTSIKEYQFWVPFFKFETYANKGAENLDPVKDFDQIQKIRLSNSKKYETELLESLRTPYDLEKAIMFVENQVNRLLTEYGHLE